MQSIPPSTQRTRNRNRLLDYCLFCIVHDPLQRRNILDRRRLVDERQNVGVYIARILIRQAARRIVRHCLRREFGILFSSRPQINKEHILSDEHTAGTIRDVASANSLVTVAAITGVIVISLLAPFGSPVPCPIAMEAATKAMVPVHKVSFRIMITAAASVHRSGRARRQARSSRPAPAPHTTHSDR